MKFVVAVALAMFFFFFSHAVGLTYFQKIIACTVALYLPSYLDGSEYTGHRYWESFATLLPGYMKKGRLIFDQKLDQKSQYIFCSHPHGVTSAHHGMLLSGVSSPSFNDVIPGHTRRHLGANIIFKIPIYRDILLWLGCVDASRLVANKILREGKSILILVGGEAEQLLSQRNEQRVYLRNRKGFVKLAITHGISIVPSYNFGETQLYTTTKFMFPLRKWISKTFGIAITIGYGRNVFLPFLTHNDVELVQVFGRPLNIQKNENPSNEQVDALHTEYAEELQRIFNKYKHTLGYGDQDLIID